MSTVKHSLLSFVCMKVAEWDIAAALLSLIFNKTRRIHQKYGHMAQQRSDIQYHFHPGIQKPIIALEKIMADFPVTISGINFFSFFSFFFFFWGLLYHIYILYMPIISWCILWSVKYALSHNLAPSPIVWLLGWVILTWSKLRNKWSESTVPLHPSLTSDKPFSWFLKNRVNMIVAYTQQPI